MNYIIILKMAIIYTPISDNDDESWKIIYNNGNVRISLLIVNINNGLYGHIYYFIDNNEIFIIDIYDGITEFIDIKKSSEIFDIEFTQEKHQTSIMNFKFINKIKELMCLFDLSEEPFRKVFAEFINPMIKSSIY